METASLLCNLLSFCACSVIYCCLVYCCPYLVQMLNAHSTGLPASQIATEPKSRLRRVSTCMPIASVRITRAYAVNKVVCLRWSLLFHHLSFYHHQTIVMSLRPNSYYAQEPEQPRFFRTPEERAQMSPSSSPEVSPTASPIQLPADSSPLSSPDLEPVDLNDSQDGSRPWLPSFQHPYAGSTNSNRRPPLYEMKPKRVNPYEDDVFHDVWQAPKRNLPLSTPWTVPMAQRKMGAEELTREEQEHKLWKDTIDNAVDEAKGIVDLSYVSSPELSSTHAHGILLCRQRL